MYKSVNVKGTEVITTMTSVAEILSMGFTPVDPMTWKPMLEDVSYEDFSDGKVDFIRRED